MLRTIRKKERINAHGTAIERRNGMKVKRSKDKKKKQERVEKKY